MFVCQALTASFDYHRGKYRLTNFILRRDINDYSHILEISLTFMFFVCYDSHIHQFMSYNNIEL